MLEFRDSCRLEIPYLNNYSKKIKKTIHKTVQQNNGKKQR